MANAPNLEILISRPAGTSLVADYLEGRASAFYVGHFADAGAYREKAEEVDARFDRAARERAAEAVHVPSGADAGRRERFVEEGGYVVTTGQQPGLFGGPLYSLYKGVTAVRLAAALESLLDKPVLPVFWVASEDHDWEEANHAQLVDTDNELRSFSLGERPGDVRPPLSRIPLGPEAVAVRDAFIGALPQTEFSEPYLGLLRDAMTDGVTLPASFRRIMEDLLGPLGLYFTDAADPAVKAGSSEVLQAELSRSAETEAVLDDTAARLRESGYDLQVALMEGSANLFLEGPLGRERLYRDDGKFRLHASGKRLTLEEVRARTAADPGALSPNVLLRPVAESAVFPTLSYVAGPGEIAYFGQLGAYFEAFDIRMPVVFPRFGATLLEAKVRKVLEKFGLAPDALARPFHEVASDIARDEVPGEIRGALNALRGAVGEGAGKLKAAAKKLDPTLDRPVQHMRTQAFAAFDDIERKVVHAVKREREIALAQLHKAQIHLYPDGKPQERVMNPFYYLARYGGGFLDALMARFDVNFRP